ncbi:hypothetical protein [Halomarina pelagica]|uniref:hypothetical protein n=1 Tax=Halomarina pelagica TaxID=2961599 RepID=UPI0020C39F33|nr:hypothetical protein [Halomarina sp. BND7]
MVAPTILPIAAAYEFAHNYPYVIENTGKTVTVIAGWFNTIIVVDPLSWLSLAVFWGTQVLLIIAGHVIAVVAAHNVIAERTSQRSVLVPHLPLTVLMISYTMLSLWIISRPVA